MNAAYIVDDVKIANILVDPMERAILKLLREKIHNTSRLGQ